MTGIVQRIGIDHVQIILRPDLRSNVRKRSFFFRCIISLCPPVSHHNAVKSPLATKNRGQKIIVGSGEDSVHRAISGHHSPCTAFSDSDLKSFQIDLTKGALRNDSIHKTAAKFLRIAAEMFDYACRTIGIHAFDLFGCHLTGQERILGEVLKVSAIERIAVNIHTRAKQTVDLVLSQLQTFPLI